MYHKDILQGKVDEQLFFAPSHVKKRTNEWGLKGCSQRYGQTWLSFSKKVESLVERGRIKGPRKSIIVMLMVQQDCLIAKTLLWQISNF
jgi:hypothetical protein